MKLHGFILAIDSYLIRKGMVSILNRIYGVRVLKECETVSSLIQSIKKQEADFLIISETLFHSSTELFLSDAGLLEKTILLINDTSNKSDHEVHTTIFLSESKEEITGKINNMLGLRTVESPGHQPFILTQREKTIVKLVSMGLTNKQIADQLFLSPHTVTTHRKNITSKLGIKSVSGLTIYAIVNNFVTSEEATSKPSQ